MSGRIDVARGSAFVQAQFREGAFARAAGAVLAGVERQRAQAGVEALPAGSLTKNFSIDRRPPHPALEKRKAGVLYVNANANLRRIMGLRFGFMSVDESFTVENSAQAMKILDENKGIKVVVIHAIAGEERECLELYARLKRRQDTRVILAGSFSERETREAGVTFEEMLDPKGTAFVPRVIEEIAKAKILVKMLFVDDDLAMHALIKVYFSGQARVIHAKNSQEALKKLEEHPDVRVVVTDVNMRYEGEGFDLYETLAGRHGLEVLVASAGGYTDEQRDRVGLEEADILRKPLINGNLFPIFTALKQAADAAYEQSCATLGTD